MSGYSIGLFKFMRIDENIQKKKMLVESRKNICNRDQDKKHRKFVSFGEFDRIGFEEVHQFSRFRDLSENTKSWIGDRQIHLIYSICEKDYPDEIYIRDGEFYERNENEAVLSNRLFIGLTILQFKYSQKENSKDMEKFLLKCKNDILDIKENVDVKCAVFGTLGSFGLTIIWLADQYTDILNMVTKIKYKNPIFLSAYTIFAQNHKNGTDWEKKVSAIKGNAILRLTLKNGVNDEIIDKLNDWKEQKAGIYHSAGEHDVIIRMKSSKVFTAFDKMEDLYYDSDFFKKHVLQSNVQFCEALSLSSQLEKSAESDTDIPGNGSRICKEHEELLLIQDMYKQLRLIFADLFPSTVGMVDTLDLLYGDYISKISTASNEMWADDFSHQFLEVLRCLKKFIGKFQKIEMPREVALKIIDDLLGDFEWQISHIAQSNNLTLGTPVCQFRYSAQNNLTLYAYFGIIKKVLGYVYRAQEISMQDEIVPLIVADIVPIIQSMLYYDYEGSNELDSKIVTINLPMVSLYNPVCYYPFLYHEIFHYVVPNDRYARNRVFGHLMSVELLYAFFVTILRNRMNYSSLDAQIADDFANTILLKYIYADCLENYDDFIGRTVEKLDEKEWTCDEIEKIVLTADKFEQKMLLKWVQWFGEEKSILTENPVYLCICSIYRQKKKISDEIDRWEEKNSDNERAQMIKDAMMRLIEEFGGIADNNDGAAVYENYQEMVSEVGGDVTNDASILISAIKEAMADIAMVKLGDMDFSEYLLLFTKTKKDLLLVDLDKNIAEQDMIRIGMVLDFLYGDKGSDIIEAADQAREKYINMYCGIYYSGHKEKEENYFDILYNEAKSWFNYWKECLYRFYCRYGIYLTFFRELQKGHLVSDGHKDCLKECMGDESRYWKAYAEILRAFGDYMYHNHIEDYPEKWEEKKNSVQNRIFDLNIQLIHNYQYQESFMSLNKVRTARIEVINDKKYKKEINSFDNARPELVHGNNHGNSSKHYYWQYYIDNIADFSIYVAKLAERLKEANGRILGEEEYPVWYRGHESADYILIPSIMRKYKEERQKSKEPGEFSMSGFIRKKFEEFRFRSDGSQEAIERIGYTDSDYIVLMQHHSVASNFLDWTEEMLKAMYFALEGFFDKKAVKSNANAVLYIFSPALYNHARIKMIQRQSEKDPHRLEIDKETARLTLKEGIPNLSVSYNANKYYMYLLGCEKFARENLTPYDTDELTKAKRAFYLPVAVYTSRLNRRIQAQSGVFLAYDIYACPDKEFTFHYMSLEEIQKDYLSGFQDERDTCPFLYKIEIEKTKREEIASWVRACGMSKEKCYPELANIGERVML